MILDIVMLSVANTPIMLSVVPNVVAPFSIVFKNSTLGIRVSQDNDTRS
jgi:hypothetical protein